ncbi:MAG: DUF6679 family protein [Cyanobacteria bacterium P01_G01_bin.19]
MESKLRELIGQSNIWLYIKSSNGWIKNVEIQDVCPETITFRYEQEFKTETKVWEKTTRINNILEIDVRVLAIPKKQQAIEAVRNELDRLWQEDEDSEN